MALIAESMSLKGDSTVGILGLSIAEELRYSPRAARVENEIFVGRNLESNVNGKHTRYILHYVDCSTE